MSKLHVKRIGEWVNESAEVNESKVDVTYWLQYFEGEKTFTDVNQALRIAERSWNDSADEEWSKASMPKDYKKVYELASSFLKLKGWIAPSIIEAMISQESIGESLDSVNESKINFTVDVQDKIDAKNAEKLIERLSKGEAELEIGPAKTKSGSMYLEFRLARKIYNNIRQELLKNGYDNSPTFASESIEGVEVNERMSNALALGKKFITKKTDEYAFKTKIDAQNTKYSGNHKLDSKSVMIPRNTEFETISDDGEITEIKIISSSNSSIVGKSLWTKTMNDSLLILNMIEFVNEAVEVNEKLQYEMSKSAAGNDYVKITNSSGKNIGSISKMSDLFHPREHNTKGKPGFYELNLTIKGDSWNTSETIFDDKFTSFEDVQKYLDKNYDRLKKSLNSSGKSVNEAKVSQSFDVDAKEIIKQLRKAGIKAELDGYNTSIEISKNDADKANKVLQQINAFDEEYNFIDNADEVNESKTSDMIRFVIDAPDTKAEAAKLKAEYDAKIAKLHAVNDKAQRFAEDFTATLAEKFPALTSSYEIVIEPTVDGVNIHAPRYYGDISGASGDNSSGKWYADHTIRKTLAELKSRYKYQFDDKSNIIEDSKNRNAVRGSLVWRVKF